MLRVINILIALLLLSACSSPQQQAPVYDRRQPPAYKIGNHKVSAGETMFSIAWRYGLDYRTLASYNGIGSPYTIYPGQQLRLSPLTASARSATSSSASSASVYSSVTVKAVPNLTYKQPEVRSKTPTTYTPAKPVQSLGYSSSQWRWPAQGRLLNTFSSSQGLNKGIDIAGRLGEPVIAASSGVVVYAGSGIRGYGNLLIIKHNETFLSAYAHNRVLLVKEGEQVKVGQQIAEIGTSGTDRAMLHFEIRRDGTPVDPLGYLPKR